MIRIWTLVTVVALTVPVLAQEPPEPRQDPRLQFYTSQLDLSPVQIDQVSRILAVDRELARLNRERLGRSNDQLLSANEKRIADTNEEILALLDDSQAETFERIKPSSRVDEGVMHMATRLKLTPAQLEDVQRIMANSRVDELREQARASGDRSAMREVMDDVRKEQEAIDQQIEKILTAEQTEEYKKLKAEQRERMQAERGDRQQGGRGGRGGRGGSGGKRW
jgi:Spy/CpxP family protein refolding chaperone